MDVACGVTVRHDDTGVEVGEDLPLPVFSPAAPEPWVALGSLGRILYIAEGGYGWFWTREVAVVRFDKL